MPFYLGQRYVPDADRVTALAEADRLRLVQRSPARLLSTTFVPNEEWAFDVFEAESADAVEQTYRAGEVSYERITEAIHVT